MKNTLLTCKRSSLIFKLVQTLYIHPSNNLGGFFLKYKIGINNNRAQNYDSIASTCLPPIANNASITQVFCIKPVVLSNTCWYWN